MNYPIHIAFCVNDKYIPYICVTIKSIIENNKNNALHFHVISDNIPKKMYRLLYETIEGCKTVTIDTYLIDNGQLYGLKDSWSIQAWYRVFLPDILGKNIHRVLYLDADIIVAGSLKDLFSIDMTGKSIAAVIDIESFNPDTFKRCGYNNTKKYVCSGVLLMNLDYWRQYELTKQIVNWAKENNDKIKFPDQDTINYICQDTKILLPLKYGILNPFFYDNEILNSEYLPEVKECVTNPIIIHYAGQNPWKIELAKHIQNEEWNKYNRMLKHPAKRHYITKGINLLKLHIWNLLHPNSHKHFLAKQKYQLEKILNL